MSIKITRRRFFTGASVLIGGTIVGGYIAWRNTKESDIIIAILNRRLGSLHIDSKDFESYSLEAVEKRKNFKKQLRLLGVFSSLFSIMTPYSFLPLEHPLRKLENYTVSNFLLSTDFFQHKADTNRKITYLGFYDPYKRPCANFFNS